MNPEAFTLTLEQQFHLQQLKQSANQLNREEAIDLLLEATRLVMVKDNALRDLMRKVM